MRGGNLLIGPGNLIPQYSFSYWWPHEIDAKWVGVSTEMRPEALNLTMLAIELKTLALRISRRVANNDSVIRPQDVAILSGAAEIVDRLAAQAETRP
jgi:hypothetical protein